MEKYKVVEKKNPLAVHCLTWSKQRAQEWIEKYGDSKMFTDKTLNRDSFTIVCPDSDKN
ncbi:hypothetical protein [Pseudomonas phage UF_RH7]|nr:hypothetical protein [Pseudomonas phage UF_RH7]